MKKILLIFFVISLTITSHAQVDVKQRLKGYVNPEEIVTLSENIPFNQAVEVLSKVSLKLTGKTIVSTAGVNDPIGIEIDKMPYKRVLRILSQMKGLVLEELPNTIVIKSPDVANAALGEEIYAPVDSREVEISALFFDANVRDVKERGINWDYLLSKAGLSFGSKLNTFLTETQVAEGQQQVQQNLDFNVTNSTDFDIGDFSGNATAAFKYFENENLGEIIARPVVSVRNKQKGRIQIGEDISIKERDFSGNLIDKFFSTGTIIEVTPYIYNEEGIDYILLKLMVERSTGTPGQISTTIQKTSAQTEVLMLNGEETIIGGLFVNVENQERRGIPILKDLPWWVFGIRYLTGYEATNIEKREIIILVRTNILPTLKERIAQKKENLIKKALEENESVMEPYKLKNIKKEQEEEK
jgi:general secretion pathway protein D